jgi:uncharacterized membrane protein YjgN (DUF898 family)
VISPTLRDDDRHRMERATSLGGECGRYRVSTTRTACLHNLGFLTFGGKVTQNAIEAVKAQGANVVVEPDEHSASFHGNGKDLFVMYLVAALLSVVTLGLYSFWAKAKIRRYFYSQTEFAADRFAYHATGRELFFGWLRGIVIFACLAALPVGIAIAITGDVQQGIRFGAPFVYLMILPLMPLLIVSAWRFRMSRTSWRGIRFSFRGRAGEFARVYFLGIVLTAITFGIYAPFFMMNLRRYLVGNTYLGTAPFKFNGEGGPVLGRIFLALLLHIPTLGLVWIWHSAWYHRYTWGKTYFQQARFRSTVNGADLFGHYFVTGALTLLTLGLYFPWAVVRSMEFNLNRLTLVGRLDFAQIQQDARLASVTGEGLADVLDVGDTGVDLGV